MTTPEEFKEFATEMIDYAVDYVENIRKRDVVPSVKPGYMKDLLPSEAPNKPENWKEVMNDVENIIMPGLTHWQHPQFHAYFACGASYPSIVANILCDATNSIGFSWISSPACTELEMQMMDWLGKMINLPKEFLFQSKLGGGGVIQGSASESTLVALLSARSKAIKKFKKDHGYGPELHDSEIIPKLVAYASEQAHSSVEKAGLLGGVKMRLLPVDDEYSLDGETFLHYVEKDIAKGYIPFFLVAALGTTSCCSYDKIKQLGPICKNNNIWMHIDAAYAGSAFICPEIRPLLDGVEYADSLVFNPHKWLLVTHALSAFWVRDSKQLVDSFNVDPVYLRYESDGNIPDYRHWHIPLGRRFRALKLWFVIRLYGVEGLQNYIRHHIKLAKEFDALVRTDDRFEIPIKTTVGLVCFRLKGPNHLSESLNKKINDEKVLHMSPSVIKNKFILRLAICSRVMESHDVKLAWENVLKHTETVMSEQRDIATPSSVGKMY